MKERSILVAGIGNIFFGDDAFGVEVVRRLSRRPLSGRVKVVDFGIRGLDLAYALLDGHDGVILVDTVKRGESPGTLFVIDPDIAREPPAAGCRFDTHGLDPARILDLARAMGEVTCALRLVCCEPETFGPPDQGKMGLSKPVAAAIDPAIGMIENLVSELSAVEAPHA